MASGIATRIGLSEWFFDLSKQAAINCVRDAAAFVANGAQGLPSPNGGPCTALPSVRLSTKE